MFVVPRLLPRFLVAAAEEEDEEDDDHWLGMEKVVRLGVWSCPWRRLNCEARKKSCKEVWPSLSRGRRRVWVRRTSTLSPGSKMSV